MNKQRLLALAALLDVVPEDKFDMHRWGFTDAPMEEQPRCSTKACALGWATSIPAFNKAGLELVAKPGELFAHVRFGGYINSEAAMHFFGIRYGQALDLFESGSSTAKHKAKEIRALVARCSR